MGKGLQDENQTGFDILAEYLSMCGISVPPIQINGHYTHAAIVSAISSINMTPPTFSKSCSIQEKPSVFGSYIALTVDGVVLINSASDSANGSFTVDASGNITKN